MLSKIKLYYIPISAFVIFSAFLVYAYVTIDKFLYENIQHQRGNRHIIKINLLVNKGISEAFYAMDSGSADDFINAAEMVESAIGYMSTIPEQNVGIPPEVSSSMMTLIKMLDDIYDTYIENGSTPPVSERQSLMKLSSGIFTGLASADMYFYDVISADSLVMKKHVILSLLTIFSLTFIIMLMSIRLRTNLNKRIMLTEELQDAKKNLEERVERRTQELSRMNLTLTEKVEEEIRTRRFHEQVINEQKKLADMGQMINAIAHQWRQPLNVLGLLGQELVDLVEEGHVDDKFIETFKNTHYNMVTFLSTTIDDFRDFYKPDKNKENFNIYFEIKNILKLIDIQFASSKIRIETECSCANKQCNIKDMSINNVCLNKNTMVDGYPGEFKQVLINIFYNAKDAISDSLQKGDISFGQIKVRVTFEKEKATVTISNNGEPISEDVRPHIFEPYYTTKGEGKGTGLGLYMSKTVIETHMNGNLYLDDNEGKTAFVIELPVTA
ncbi:MAG: sensor histidine kinase [Deferribacterales bacterium]